MTKNTYDLKTLQIRVDGALEMYCDGLGRITDIGDPCLPAWAVTDMEGVIATLNDMDAFAVHFESSSWQIMNHINLLDGNVVDWEEDLPESFKNLDQLYKEYLEYMLSLVTDPPETIQQQQIDEITSTLEMDHGIQFENEDESENSAILSDLVLQAKNKVDKKR